MFQVSVSQLLGIAAVIAFATGYESLGFCFIGATFLAVLCEGVNQKREGGIPVEKIRKNLKLSHFNVPYTAPVFNVLTWFGFKIKSEPTKMQSRYLSKVVNKLGYRIEPDADMTGKKYLLNEYVCVYSDMHHLPVTVNYQMAVLFAELGYKVLSADENVSKSETWFLEKTLADEFELNASERLRLQKRIELMAYGLSTQTGIILRRLLQTVDVKSRSLIADFIIAVAASDGVIHLKEMELLQKLFKQLGFAQADLSKALERLKSTQTTLTIQERFSQNNRKRWNEQKITDEPEKVEFKLDAEKLSHVMLNTADIQKTLGAIFANEIAEENDVVSENGIAIDEKTGEASENKEKQIDSDKINDEMPEDAPVEDGEEDDDTPEFIDEIIEQSEWSKKDLLDLIGDTGQLLSCYVDEVNEWSEELYGDFLLIEDEERAVYEVNPDVVELIEAEDGKD